MKKTKHLKSVDEKDPRLVYVKIEDACTPPPGLIEHLQGKYWLHHKTKGLLFFRSGYNPATGHHQCLLPMCNNTEKITQQFNKMYPWAETIYVPSVFRKINIKDYT